MLNFICIFVSFNAVKHTQNQHYTIWGKYLIFDFIFDFTAAGVVPCGGRKTSPRTSTIVQFIFYFGPSRSHFDLYQSLNRLPI